MYTVTAMPYLLVLGAAFVAWLMLRTFRLSGPGKRVGLGLTAWALAWLVYFLDDSGVFGGLRGVSAAAWALLFLGYVPFIELLYRLSRKVRMPVVYYGFALFPSALTLIAGGFTDHDAQLYVLLLLQLVLLYFGLPAWYAVPLGRAPEGRLLWLPTLVFVQVSITNWAALPPLVAGTGIHLGFLLWAASLWLIVEGLVLESQSRPIGTAHLAASVTVFMGMWVLVVLRWIDAGAGIVATRPLVVLSSLAGWGGVLSIVLPLHLSKNRSESKLTQWSSILSDLALFPLQHGPATPESLGNELLNLLRRACDRVVGLRLSVFDDLILGERSRYGLTLKDRGIPLGRVYLGGDRRCGPFLKVLVPMVGQRLGEVMRSLDWQVQAHTDPLTGLLNRRGFEVQLPYTLERAGGGHKPITLAMLDLDHFKRVNDTYGHLTGDVLLQAVAELLERNLRSGDLAVRWGGEEFLVLLFDSDQKRARQIFERIRQRIAELDLTDFPERITASVGLAGGAVPESRDDVMRWINQADEALIRAKSTGRDRIVTAE